MIKRRYGPLLHGFLRRFPCVTVLGPRQCGKTTFIRAALPAWTYLDLERPSDSTPLAADPEARLNQMGDNVIFDEAQRVPELFPVLRGVIDRRRGRKGRFVLLGSASPSLVRQISESLAGRTAFVDLAPFRWSEVRGQRRDGLQALWFRGGFPEAFLQRDDRARRDWWDSYTRTFIERDLPALGIDVSASQMRRLWAMLAHCNGGVWNASQLAASLAVSYHTVNRYVDILEQTFLIRKLPPYFANIGKRLVKSPKLYFRDSGLLHFFLGIHSPSILDTHPARGMSWEAFIIDQLMSHSGNGRKSLAFRRSLEVKDPCADISDDQSHEIRSQVPLGLDYE
ncbi:MAG TPA: ATP-binding protein, partial [Candidatus Acidoferrales bacterium]|nr:ATP-binding protein [Candidatus Acidoferrales bacterium]